MNKQTKKTKKYKLIDDEVLKADCDFGAEYKKCPNVTIQSLTPPEPVPTVAFPYSTPFPFKVDLSILIDLHKTSLTQQRIKNNTQYEQNR